MADLLRHVCLAIQVMPEMDMTLCLLGNLRSVDLSRNQLRRMPRSMAAMHSLTALNVSFNQLEEIDQVRGLRQCSARQTIFYNKHVLKQHSAYLFKVVWQGMSCIRALISLKMDTTSLLRFRRISKVTRPTWFWCLVCHLCVSKSDDVLTNRS